MSFKQRLFENLDKTLKQNKWSIAPEIINLIILHVLDNTQWVFRGDRRMISQTSNKEQKKMRAKAYYCKQRMQPHEDEIKQYEINLKIIQCDNTHIKFGVYRLQYGKKGGTYMSKTCLHRIKFCTKGSKHYLVNGWKKYSKDSDNHIFVDPENEQMPVQNIQNEQTLSEESSDDTIGCEVILHPLKQRKYKDSDQRIIGIVHYLHNGKIINLDNPFKITCYREDIESDCETNERRQRMLNPPPLSFCFGVEIFNNTVIQII